jgi:putative drug exporter of the RND superfamily
VGSYGDRQERGFQPKGAVVATGTEQQVRDDGTARPARWRRRLLPALVILAFVVVGGWLGGLGGKLSEVQRNDSAAHLPSGAEATTVLAESNGFNAIESTSAIVVYTKPSTASQPDDSRPDEPLVDADRKEIILVSLLIVSQLNQHLASPPIGPIISDDGRSAEIIVRFIGSDEDQIREDVASLRELAATTPDYLETHVTGPAAGLADLTEVFSEINGVLLLVTGGVILLILIVAYGSLVLPFVVLAVASAGLGLATGIAYLLARAELITISGDAQSILDVLVLGAGTDYALLLASRYREELRHQEDKYAAMRTTVRASAAPIAASGGTVILGLLCLVASRLPATRVLGPVAVIAIGCALLSMLVLLPAALLLLGRNGFWPLRPKHGQGGVHSGWKSVAGRVGRRPRLVWVLTTLVLVGLSVGLVRLEAHGVPRTESFLADADSVTGQVVLSRHFPLTAATPAVIIANAGQLDAVVSAAVSVSGVAEVEPYLDPLEKYDNEKAGKPDPAPQVVNGLVRVEATLADAPDSAAAVDTVRRLRQAVRAIPGADAKIGGYTASNLDIQDTATRDRWVIIPLVLTVVFIILALLLRALVAPLLLIATVVLSFLATMGVSGVVFRDLLGFAGADSTLPLSAFVFLVALGVDYNIFLMTRVREETIRQGHRAGTLAGLSVTGGVITSAGVVLAATFAALAVLPLVFLAELAFAVAFGVLLDALVVRTLLVPALTLDLGRKVWWPGPLRRADP